MKYSEANALVQEIMNEHKCLITGDELTTPNVTLECGHSFNYYPLMHALVISRLITPHDSQPTNADVSKLNEQFGPFGECHQFWCPYCRQSQTKLVELPENADKMYGINTDELVNELRIDGCKWTFTPEHVCEHKDCFKMYMLSENYKPHIKLWTACEPLTNKHYCWAHLTKIEQIKRQIKHQNEERLKRGLDMLCVTNPLSFLNIQLLHTKYCSYQLTRGVNKGLFCKEKVKNNNHMCGRHLKQCKN